MAYEEETEYNTGLYRCIDPIENLKIRVVLQPIKSLQVPLPRFEKDGSSPDITSFAGDNQADSEEYTFKWQEKKFSRHEIKKYSSESDWKKRILEKYKDACIENINNLNTHSSKLFSYVEADDYKTTEADVNIFTGKTNYLPLIVKKMNNLKISDQSIKNYKNVPKRKIINYKPSNEFRNQSHFIVKNAQKMFIMVDLGTKIKVTKKAEKEEIQESVLCSLSYDFSNNILQVTPAFSESKLKPYIVGLEEQDSRNSYHYWVYHESSNIPVEDLTKEIGIMSKVFDHQEEIRKLQLESEFYIGKPNHLCLTLLGEIVSARDFEYDQLHVHYFLKLPPGWEYSDNNALSGRTHSSFKNSEGICYFCHLFEVNFLVDLKTLEESTFALPEIIFEVLSVDKYRRYRNEGYTFITLPSNPGIHIFNLTCWRPLDKTIKSQLERFFIGGGPELEDISYVGLSTTEKEDVMSRFGLETSPSGKIDIKLNILHQSEIFKTKKGEEVESERNILNRLDAGSLLGSVNTVLEAFRRARERMLQAKKGLETDLNYCLPGIQSDFERKVTIIETKESK